MERYDFLYYEFSIDSKYDIRDIETIDDYIDGLKDWLRVACILREAGCEFMFDDHRAYFRTTTDLKTAHLMSKWMDAVYWDRDFNMEKRTPAERVVELLKDPNCPRDAGGNPLMDRLAAALFPDPNTTLA
jgi:hypothetical protein